LENGFEDLTCGIEHCFLPLEFGVISSKGNACADGDAAENDAPKGKDHMFHRDFNDVVLFLRGELLLSGTH